MFAAIVSMTLAYVFQISIFAVLCTAFVVWLAKRKKCPELIKLARFLVAFILGIFGVFRCKCLDTTDHRKPGFCWFWMELENCVSTSLALVFGAIVMGLTLSLIPLMISGGITSIITLASPVALYMVYPLTLYGVKRDCAD